MGTKSSQPTVRTCSIIRSKGCVGDSRDIDPVSCTKVHFQDLHFCTLFTETPCVLQSGLTFLVASLSLCFTGFCFRREYLKTIRYVEANTFCVVFVVVFVEANTAYRHGFTLISQYSNTSFARQLITTGISGANTLVTSVSCNVRSTNVVTILYCILDTLDILCQFVKGPLSCARNQ